MGHQWILDVIVDLKSFAQQNALPDLADELDRVAAVAKAEIDPDKRGVPHLARSEETEPGPILTRS